MQVQKGLKLTVYFQVSLKTTNHTYNSGETAKQAEDKKKKKTKLLYHLKHGVAGMPSNTLQFTFFIENTFQFYHNIFLNLNKKIKFVKQTILL